MRRQMSVCAGWVIGVVVSAGVQAEMPAPQGDASGAGRGCVSPDEARRGWVSVFDGRSLDGWHVSGKTGHGSGGKWVVAGGAIVGSQDTPGNGGIVLTDATYGDFEVAVEMNNDYGPDSGLFLRSTEDGKCYQAMIDYHDNGNLMGVYGEGIGGFAARNFRMLDDPYTIKVVAHEPYPCPFTPEQWRNLWKKGWNNLRARITGNPPTVETWINGVRVMDWTDTEKRLPDTGGIALQVHGGGDYTKQFVRYRNVRVREIAPDNTLSAREKALGWRLLFDGRTLDGWTTDEGKASKVGVDDGCIQPHGCGGYMMIHERPWGDFILAADFKISEGCNSGIFVRTFPLTPYPGKSVGYNGLEMAIDDTTGAGYHDTGAIYDLVAPTRNVMRPVGAWNRAVITCEGPIMTVELNGEVVSRIDLDEWPEADLRPDGSTHKFRGQVFKEHPRRGYIGLQDHGSPAWFKNIKLLPLEANDE